MSWLCSEGCHPLCDFCKHYDFNGVGKPSVYVGKGFCRLHQKRMEPDNACEDFHCGMTPEAQVDRTETVAKEDL